MGPGQGIEIGHEDPRATADDLTGDRVARPSGGLTVGDARRLFPVAIGENRAGQIEKGLLPLTEDNGVKRSLVPSLVPGQNFRA